MTWKAVALVLLVILAITLALLAASASGGRAVGGAGARTYIYEPGIDHHPELFEAEARTRGYRATTGPTADVVMIRRPSLLNDRWRQRTAGRVWSFLGIEKITNKAQFQKTFAGDDFAPKGRVTPQWPEPSPPLGPGVWMFRPSVGAGGWGMRVVNSDEELRRARGQKKISKRGVVTRYIADTETHKMPDGTGRKITLRIHLLIARKRGGPLRLGRFTTTGKIILAKKPYDPSDSKDPGVFDTHTAGDTSLVRPYPAEYQGDAGRVDAQLDAISRRIAEAVAPHARVLAGADAGFRLLGLDVMVDSKGKAWLIEVNENPRFPAAAQAALVYKTIWAWAIDPVFGKKGGPVPDGFVEVAEVA